MTPLELPEAVEILVELSGFTEDQVVADPTTAAEYAAARCIQARDVVREAIKSQSIVPRRLPRMPS